MMKTKQWLLSGASFAVLMMGSVAHASTQLCTGRGDADGRTGAWTAICAGGQGAYAAVEVIWHSWGDDLYIHVTDHFDCPSGTHMQCEMKTSLADDYECLVERDPYTLSVDGAATWVTLKCGCYSPDEDCHSDS